MHLPSIKIGWLIFELFAIRIGIKFVDILPADDQGYRDLQGCFIEKHDKEITKHAVSKARSLLCKPLVFSKLIFSRIFSLILPTLFLLGLWFIHTILLRSDYDLEDCSDY